MNARSRYLYQLGALALLFSMTHMSHAAPVPATPSLCLGRVITIFGTSGPDTIKGTRGPDVIAGMGSNDKIYGGGGYDVICAGGGNDFVDGGRGKDVIMGGRGNDFLRGGFNDDTLYGALGFDQLHGDSLAAEDLGEDQLYAGADDSGPDEVTDFLVGDETGQPFQEIDVCFVSNNDFSMG